VAPKVIRSISQRRPHGSAKQEPRFLQAMPMLPGDV